MFQFHNGSIKRLGVRAACEVGRRFQFHNGSIKSEYAETNSDSDSEFQFHNGSIKSWPTADINDSHRCVSIPQWFD